MRQSVRDAAVDARALRARSSFGAGWLVEAGALHLACLEDLEHVALLHVVEAVEEDAALEALRYLARIVLEALELGDRRLVDHRAVTHDTHLAVATDDTIRDHAAGD